MENNELDIHKSDSPLPGEQVQEVIGLLLAHPEDEDHEMACSKADDSGSAISRSLETQVIQLEDFVHGLADESSSESSTPKFIDGQAVQLEDGTTAFIHTSHSEGLQAVQLEDGTTAYISTAPPEALFGGEASALGLDQISTAQISDQDDDKEGLGIKVTLGVLTETRSASVKAIALGDRAFRCPYEGCGRLYTTQHHLKVHERSHTGDRPFKCTAIGCNKMFATGYGLKSHTRVHTGETPYKCPEKSCQKAFKTSGDLQKHVRTHTGERPFKCPFEGCNRAFTTSNIRKVHIRTHTGERPYTCKEDGCHRAFASATNYKNHIRIHTGEKPYICAVTGCGKRFTEYSSLYKHHVVHTHTKPYSCGLCGRNYRQTSTLAMHRRTAHGILEDTEPTVSITTVDPSPCLEEGESEEDPSSKRGRLEFQLESSLASDEVVTPDITPQQITMVTAADGTILTLQAPSNGQQLQGGGSSHQIVVVADPAQLAALQQFAQQARLMSLSVANCAKVEQRDADDATPQLIPTTTAV